MWNSVISNNDCQRVRNPEYKSMFMKTRAIINFVILFVFTSAIIPGCISVDWFSKWELTYINETEHKIEIRRYQNGSIVEDLSLAKGKNVSRVQYEDPGVGIFADVRDSVFVIYDETILIKHYPVPDFGPASPQKNICFTSSYRITSTKKIKEMFRNPDKIEYCAEYIFTEEDYEEALKIYHPEKLD
ncbi:MAG: hypothetical protein FWG54_00050, partial [Bacteroidetes bacterium]|nr:hypothetical protein [Bacteroidota bacterium]